MLDTCLCFPREMEPGYGLYLPILTMVVLQASLLATVGKFKTSTEFAKSVTVFNAIRWISSPWNNVREEIILNLLAPEFGI